MISWTLPVNKHGYQGISDMTDRETIGYQYDTIRFEDFVKALAATDLQRPSRLDSPNPRFVPSAW